MTDKVNISSIVSSQFPSFIREDYEAFVAFVKAYYEFLQQDYSTDLKTIRDIDTTLDEYVKHFKSEYASNIPFTLANERFVLSNIKDLNLAKGSEQSYRLLFRLLFDKEITIGYPGQQMLRASDGRWEQKVSIFVGVVSPTHEQVVTGNKNIDKIVNNVVEITTSTGPIKTLVYSYKNLQLNIDGRDVYELSIDRRFFGNIAIDDRVTLGGDFIARIVPTIAKFNVVQSGKNFRVGELYEIGTTGTILKIVETDIYGAIVFAQIIKYDMDTKFTDDFIYELISKTDLAKQLAIPHFSITVPGADGTGGTPGISASKDVGLSDATDGFTDEGAINSFDYNVEGTSTGFGTITTLTSSVDIAGTSTSFLSQLCDGTAWVANSLVTVGQLIYSSTNLYVVTKNGTTHASVAPIHAGTTTTLSSVTITGTEGQFSCSSTTLEVGNTISISGDIGGTGSISEYDNPSVYHIIATDGSTTFTLSLYRDGPPIITTIGTPTGVTYTKNDTIALNGTAEFMYDGKVGSGKIIKTDAGVIVGIVKSVTDDLTLTLTTNANVSVSTSAYTIDTPTALDGTYSGKIFRTWLNEPVTEKIDTSLLAYINFSLGGVSKYPGFYTSNNGFLDDAMFIQDSKFYQIYSYLLTIDEKLDTYKSAVKTLLHPSGVALFGEYPIINELDLSTELESTLKSLIIILKDSMSVQDRKDHFDVAKALPADLISLGVVQTYHLDRAVTVDTLDPLVDGTTNLFGKSVSDAVEFTDDSRIFDLIKGLSDAPEVTDTEKYFHIEKSLDGLDSISLDVVQTYHLDRAVTVDTLDPLSDETTNLFGKIVSDTIEFTDDSRIFDLIKGLSDTQGVVDTEKYLHIEKSLDGSDSISLSHPPVVKDLTKYMTEDEQIIADSGILYLNPYLVDMTTFADTPGGDYMDGGRRTF